MKKTWLTRAADFERFILTGDAGGTNTSLALFGNTGRNFTMLLKCDFLTKEITSFLDPVGETLAEAASANPSFVPTVCCVSSAGPVKDNICRLTNASWAVDGNAIEERFGFRALAINDFMALSYGMPLLDVENPQQITKVPHTDGACPKPAGERLSVVGAGTGLGTGFLMEVGGRYFAVPAEGGHSDFAAFDDETVELLQFLRPRFGIVPGTEELVSGRGITHIYHFYKGRGMAIRGALAEIDRAPDDKKPALISAHVDDSPDCRSIMSLFVRVYARYAARAALMYMPTRGLFVAGGIVEKNEGLFLQDHLFMRSFEQNYKENIREVLKGIPVFIVRDYATSHYGAANAAYSLLL